MPFRRYGRTEPTPHTLEFNLIRRTQCKNHFDTQVADIPNVRTTVSLFYLLSALQTTGDTFCSGHFSLTLVLNRAFFLYIAQKCTTWSDILPIAPPICSQPGVFFLTTLRFRI